MRHLIEAEVGRTQVSGQCSELIPFLKRAFDVGSDVIVEFRQGKYLPKQLQTEHGAQLDSALHWVHPNDTGTLFRSKRRPLIVQFPFESEKWRLQGLHWPWKNARTILVDALVTHPERSMHDGSFTLWTEKNYRYVNIQHETIEGLRGVRGFCPDTPWRRLSPDAQQLVLFGSGSAAVAAVDRRTGRKIGTPRYFPGFVPEILRRAEGRGSASRLADLVTEGSCRECRGTRWSSEARALRLGQWSVQELLGLPFDKLRKLARPQGLSGEDNSPIRHDRLRLDLHHGGLRFRCGWPWARFW